MNIPGINLDSQAVSTDALSQYLTDLQTQLRARTRAICGDLNYGVISRTNPAAESATANPLWVGPGTSEYTAKVYAGIGVTASGDFLEIADTREIQLAVVSEGAENLVFMYLESVTNTVRVLTSTGKMVPTGSGLQTQLTVMSTADYLAMPQGLRDQGLVLASVTYYASGNTFLYTDSARSWLRPWFSSVDAEHRSHLGSGQATSNNPHATGINDLTDASGRGVYSQLTKSGMVFSRDSSVSGIPGYLCSATYTASEFRIDNTGEVTKNSVFGGAGVFYVQLDAYATQILRVSDLDAIAADGTATENRYEYIVDLIPGTRVLVFVTDRVPTVGIQVHYLHTPTLEITSETAASLSFSGVDSQELVITEDLGLSDIQSAVVFIRKYNAIPMGLRVVARGTGVLALDPHVVAANQKPSVLGTQAVSVAETFTCPMYIGVGATKLGVSSNMELRVTLAGTNVDGQAITETLILNPTTWADTVDVIATQEPLKQVLWTRQSFASLDSYRVDSAIAVDASGYFQIYGRIDPARAHTAAVASMFWNKRELRDIRDIRRILPTVRDGIYGQTAISALGELITCTNQVLLSQSSTLLSVQLIASEDFQQPQYVDATTVIWEGREVLDTAVIPTNIGDSQPYTNCYRSRMLGMNKSPSQQVLVIVVLHNVDSARCGYGSVRVRVANYDQSYEVPLKLLANDSTNRTYIGLIEPVSSQQYRGIGFVVSGKCQGYSAYFVIPNAADTTQSIPEEYSVTPLEINPNKQRKS